MLLNTTKSLENIFGTKVSNNTTYSILDFIYANISDYAEWLIWEFLSFNEKTPIPRMLIIPKTEYTRSGERVCNFSNSLGIRLVYSTPSII